MRALFLLVLALPMSAACGGPACPTLPHTDPDGAISSLRSMRERATVIRAEASVDQRGEEGRVRGTVLMFVERPDHVRFDAMTQFGPAAVLTSDGAHFALTDLRENRFMTGVACPSNIARLLGIRMSGEEVARFLRGDTPLIDAERAEIECTGDGTYLVRRYAANGQRQEIEIDIREADRTSPPEQQRLRLLRSEVFDEDGTVWRISYDDYRVVEDPRSDASPRMGVAFPYRVRFEDPRGNADTLVRFESIDLNVDVPAGVFTQTQRPGIPSEVVECD